MIATFADDAVLLSTHTNIKTAVENLQQIVNSSMQWFKIWHLTERKGRKERFYCELVKIFVYAS